MIYLSINGDIIYEVKVHVRERMILCKKLKLPVVPTTHLLKCQIVSQIKYLNWWNR